MIADHVKKGRMKEQDLQAENKDNTDKILKLRLCRKR